MSSSRSPKQKAAAKRRLALIFGALGVAVAAIVLVVALTGDDEPVVEPADGISEINDVTVDGAAIAGFTEVETESGTAAPQVTGVNFSGEPITLIESGKPTIIGFFAHWCPHCQAEVDSISRHLGEAGLPDDVNIVAVSTSVNSDDGNYPPSAWFESEGWPTPILTDDADSSAARAYGLSGFPFWAIVDADGNLVTRVAGEISAEEFDGYVELARGSAAVDA